MLWLTHGILSLLFGIAGTFLAFWHTKHEKISGKYSKPLAACFLFDAGFLGLCAWGFAFYGVNYFIPFSFILLLLIPFSSNDYSPGFCVKCF